jgi:FkbM family methyltransferase
MLQSSSEKFPAATRFLLRNYMACCGWIPDGKRWLVEDLKRRSCNSATPVQITLPPSIRLEIDLTSAIGRDLYFHGSHERELIAFLRNVLRPGMSVIDAGANVGEISLIVSRLIGESGRVYSFEVSPKTLPRLRRNIALNRAQNIEVVEAAVCGSDGPLTFYLGQGADSGSSSLSQPHDYTGDHLTVPGMRLDTFVRSRSISQIDLIKLDIEGAELDALQGAEALLSEEKPPIIVFEYHEQVSSRAGWTIEDVRVYLDSFGLELRSLRERVVRDGRCNYVAATAKRWKSREWAKLLNAFE